jgi:Na+-driven multidrug efflux pump
MTTYRPFRFGSLAPGRIRRMLGHAAPETARGIVTMLGFLLFLKLHAVLGTRETAAGTILSGIASAGLLPVMGMGLALQTLVRRPLAEGRTQDARRLVWRGVRLSCAGLLLPCLVLLVFPDSIVSSMTPDGRVLQLARPAARILALAILLDTIPRLLVAGLRGAHPGRWVSASPLAHFTVLLPLAWFLGVHLQWGVPGLWLAVPASSAALAIPAWVKLRGSSFQSG